MADAFITINSLKLDRDGFCTSRDLTPLLGKVYRGDNFVAQGVDGTTFREKVVDERTLDLPFLVRGTVDKDGSSHSDEPSGVWENVEQIIATCVTGSASSTVTATLTLPDATTRSASVGVPEALVQQFQGDMTGKAALLILRVVVPAGAFTT